MFVAVRIKSLDPVVTLLIALPVLTLLLCSVACGGGGSGSGAATLSAGTPTAIAFSSDRALDGSDALNTNQPNGLGGVSNIWTINSDGSGLTAITKLSGSAVAADSIEPQWSPDGTKIVYSSGRALDGSDNPATGSAINIWVSNADGSGATPVTQLTVYAPCRGPVWSPDGKKIAYYSWRGLDGSNTNAGESTVWNIWVVNVDGSGDTPITQLTGLGGASDTPKWSPDGTKLALRSERALDGSNAGNGVATNIWVVNADGSGATALTHLTGGVGSYDNPLWSRDGTTLIFNSDDPSSSTDDIWSARPDGSGLAQITHNGRTINYATNWSPNGAAILYTSSVPTNGGTSPAQSLNIWSMNADGSKQTPLTKLNSSGAAQGMWSPDGTRIAYLSDRALDGFDKPDATHPVINLWLMKADGSGSVPLTRLTQIGVNFPTWKP